MSMSDMQPIIDLTTRLDDAKPQRFSFTQAAYDNNEIEGVDNFNISNNQNIPNPTKTDYDPNVIDRGARSQAASLPRMSWNHFIGRFSYNLAKLTQQFLAFLNAEKRQIARNANEYDHLQSYLVDDVCFTRVTIMPPWGVVAGDMITALKYYRRKSTSPLNLVGSNPETPAQTDWQLVVDYAATFPQLPPNSVGYRKLYSVIDLTSGAYLTTTWYPVVVGRFEAGVGAEGNFDANALLVDIEAYTVGPVTGQPSDCRAELCLSARFTGKAASSAATVHSNSFILQSTGADLGIGNSPIGYSVLPLGSQAVLWLRGGSKYAVWNSFGQVFAVKTASYDNGLGDSPIAPSTSRVFAFNNKKLFSVLSTPNAAANDEAVNLGQLNTSLDSGFQKAKKERIYNIYRTMNGKEKSLFLSAYFAVPHGMASTTWTGICWSPELSMFVAVAGGTQWSASAISTTIGGYSYDGVKWYQSVMPASSPWKNVCWSAKLGMFIATCGSANDIVISDNYAISYDGISWTLSHLPSASNWGSSIWIEELGIFLILGSAGASGSTGVISGYRSTDGFNWTSINMVGVGGSNSLLAGVTWSKELSRLVAIGMTGNNAFTSSDGITWTVRTLPTATQPYTDVNWSAEHGVFFALNVLKTEWSISTDGFTWSRIALPAVSDNNPGSLVFAIDTNLLVAIKSSSYNSPLYYSANGGRSWATAPFSINSINIPINCGAWSPELGMIVFTCTGNVFLRTISLKEF